MTQLYKIKPLRWSGKITFAADGGPDGSLQCTGAPLSISGNVLGYDPKTDAFTKADPEKKYRLEWCLAEYYDEWTEYYPTIKAAKQRAWGYWLDYLEPKLVKVGDEMPGQAKEETNGQE